MRNALSVRNLGVSVPGRTLFLGLSFDLVAGDSLSITGPSGSGKTSLLTCLAGIESPTMGQIEVDGISLQNLSQAKRAAFRLRNIGLVFQFGDLLPELPVLMNVALPLQLRGIRRKEAEGKAGALLKRVGLEQMGDAKPETLSGGEVQRVGIARALVSDPEIILADEPTGALDEFNSSMITELLLEQASVSKAAVVIASHDPLVYTRTSRRLDVREFAPDTTMSLKRQA